eukprot:CAMPEP_0174384846 /NCGR_PEP_ID=MMETSP0811_2-20130205/126187_1 /TAXON_ID=73025 ORGANISM="Eutreptiella gymnastica-like, Strain CCMP1594" /NCGR_SAMPLE_ID=MMETSP0811_2 /ASSEMBLY_ACC=CAM_ASM_000667 /LENGTH=62 /DNA_ID=CAMNT_0015538929 /DNA_START=1428 /DNA_END=1616 /DNA_ORIENTATION=+
MALKEVNNGLTKQGASAAPCNGSFGPQKRDKGANGVNMAPKGGYKCRVTVWLVGSPLDQGIV